ncbi:flagellin, partial [Campylobacter coli]|nr:flagellin [Campylobacter coli]
LSLVKNDGKDILISGSNLSSAGFGATQFISQASVSLRESKGRFDANIADAMGFGSVNKGVILSGFSTVTAYMSSAGSGFSAGSGYSVGSGKNYSTSISGIAVAFSSGSGLSAVYNVSAGSGFSSQSGLSQFATMKTSVGNSLGVKDETAGVTTLKGAMAVMDIAETATTNLDQIRADIGSVQNQLQVTINNITVTQVNVKAAESTIRDVDFAAESANFSKYNILAQSGSYAMSQANAVQQNVLKLLQ